jgi:hypothetical protein
LISLSEIGLFPKTAQACAATISSQSPSGQTAPALDLPDR